MGVFSDHHWTIRNQSTLPQMDKNTRAEGSETKVKISTDITLVKNSKKMLLSIISVSSISKCGLGNNSTKCPDDFFFFWR